MTATQLMNIAGQDIAVINVGTVVVGTGAAGYCAAARLAQAGVDDVVMVTDKVTAGTSRNAGSDKQTYYKLTLAGGGADSVRDMAQTLFDGGAMDGDHALIEAALSTRAFLHLVDLGVPFPQTNYGEFVGYKTDHDPRQRATSAGPYTSRAMVERLELAVQAAGIEVIDDCLVVDIITLPRRAGESPEGLSTCEERRGLTSEARSALGDGAGGRQVAGLLVLRTAAPSPAAEPVPGRRAGAAPAKTTPAPVNTTSSPAPAPANTTAEPGRPHDPLGTGPTWLLFRCARIVYATGGPAGLYSTSVYPHGQWGATGAAFRAGALGKNLTEWQFGLASLRPRWNVSGTYMQALPRFVSTDADGGDEREFLADTITDYGRLLSLTFLKGYQWPFDIRKAAAGSSLIDLLVYQEIRRGRRVFLDFRRNPGYDELDPAVLTPEARDYLERAGALGGTPVQRLRHMNEPAYQFYLGKGPAIDLEKELLEIGVCAQHNNGGLAADAWWQSNLAGLFPVGEAAGIHGVYRPGGSALNSGQVGALRAAEHIAAHDVPLPSLSQFAAAARPVVVAAAALADAAAGRAAAGRRDNAEVILRTLQETMSAQVGLVRSPQSIREALANVRGRLGTFADEVVANPASRQAVRTLFLARDLLLTAYVYLTAMDDYLTHGGRSRGSVLCTDQAGSLPQRGYGDDPAAELDLPEDFRFRLDDGALDNEIQEVGWRPEGTNGNVTCQWRARREIPSDEDVFETVWRAYRERRGI